MSRRNDAFACRVQSFEFRTRRTLRRVWGASSGRAISDQAAAFSGGIGGAISSRVGSGVWGVVRSGMLRRGTTFAEATADTVGDPALQTIRGDRDDRRYPSGRRMRMMKEKDGIYIRTGRSAFAKAMARARGRGRRWRAGETAEVEFVGQGPTGHST